MEESCSPPAPLRLVLTMIVKNESRIIERCLRAVAELEWVGEAKDSSRLVDAVCLVDTGSEDDTCAIAERVCRKLELPCRIVQDPWLNFGHNRSRSFLALTAWLRGDREFGRPPSEAKGAEGTPSGAKVSMGAAGKGEGEAEPATQRETAPAESMTIFSESCARLSFAPDRTFALLVDADMVLKAGPDGLRRSDLEGSGGFTALQRSGSALEYYNVRLIRADLPWRCIGVTHEYWGGEGGEPATLDPRKLFIQDVGDGGAKADKFERDVRLLTGDLERDPDNPRTHFYLAQSLHHSKQHARAIEHYTRRIDLGGWWEERWYAMLSIGRCYLAMGEHADAERWFLKAMAANGARGEPAWETCRMCRIRGENFKAWHYLLAAERTLPPPKKGLFVETALTHRLLYERTILGYYIGKALGVSAPPSPAATAACALASLRYLVATPEGDSHASVYSNLRFYVVPLVDLIGGAEGEQHHLLDLPTHGDFAPSSVSFVGAGGQEFDHPSFLWANVRYVDYRMDDRRRHGGEDVYVAADGVTRGRPVTTRNRLMRLRTDTLAPVAAPFAEPWDETLPIPPEREEGCMIRGLEDVRLHDADAENLLYFSATQKQFTPGQDRYRVVVGTIDTRANLCREVVVVAAPDGDGSACEKNWLAVDGGKRWIYNWHPLRVGSIVGPEQGDAYAGEDGTSYGEDGTPYGEDHAAVQSTYRGFDSYDDEVILADAHHPGGAAAMVLGNSGELRPADDGSTAIPQAKLIITREFPSPYLWRHFRGSAPPVRHRGELIAVVHFKYQEGKKMTYVHCLVALDPETLAPRRTSTPFCFRALDVEYCLGLSVSVEGVASMIFSSRDSNPERIAVPLSSLGWIAHD